jgi:hypothetical protein
MGSGVRRDDTEYVAPGRFRISKYPLDYSANQNYLAGIPAR